MNKKKIALFVLFSYLLSWSVITLYYAIFGKDYPIGAKIATIAYMSMPMVAAIIVQKFIYKEPIIKPLGISFKFNKWFIVAWLTPLVIALLIAGFGFLFPGTEFTADPLQSKLFETYKSFFSADQIAGLKDFVRTLPIHPFFLVIIQGLIAGATINALTGFGEELGWRGLMLKEMGKMNFIKSSLIIGVIWGFWHAGVYFLPNYTITPVIMITLLSIALAPIFGYITIKAKSVIAASILHGSYNGTAGLGLVIMSGGNDLLTGLLGVAGLLGVLTINLILVYYDKYHAKEKIIFSFN